MSSTSASMRRNVGHLLQPALLDDRARIAALGPHDLEHLLGDFAGDGAVGDQIEDRTELRRANRRRRDILAFLVEPAGKFVDHPIGGELGVAALRRFAAAVDQPALRRISRRSRARPPRRSAS